MGKIRLFTSGTHKGLSYTNSDIEAIAKKTADLADDQIPFVLGHPKKNLPVMGYLPKSAVVLYTEGDKVSLGFDRSAADMSDEGMEALRALGHNKLSVRLIDGVIRHIGLVERAAVNENNTQDFAALPSALSGDFEGLDPLFEESSKGFLEILHNLFKTNTKMAEQKEPSTELDAMRATVEKTAATVDRLAGLMEAQATARAAAEAAADFSGGDYAHLSDVQRKEHADFCAGLPLDKQEPYKVMVKAMAQKPQTPASGSVTADFAAATPKTEKTASDLVRAQIETL